MRALFSLNETLTPAAARGAYALFAALVAIVTAARLIRQIGKIFDGHVLSGLIGSASALAMFLGVLLVVRLAAAIWMSLTRLNDRANILIDLQRETRS